jgi:hypothetical protein
MGHSSLLDILGSFFTGGLLLLIALRLNLSTSETRQTYGYNYRNQSNLTTIVMMLEDDFSRIAYCKNPANVQVSPANKAILIADSNCFRYLTDLNDDETVEWVQYSIGLTPDETETINPNDYYLVKTFSPATGLPQQNWNLGVCQFKFQYFRAGTEVPMSFPITMFPDSLLAVGMISLDVRLESPEKPKQEFLGDTSQYQVFWRQVRVTSKNLLFR